MRNGLKEQIEAWTAAHREELVDEVIRLCSIESVKGEEKPGMPFGEGSYKALMAAVETGRNYGFAVTDYDHYVAAFDLNDGERALDILAHVDVVPAQSGWTETEAFSPVVKEGKIFGRGTSDDKGPALAAMFAMRAVRELGIPVSKNVRLILGTNEENGSSCVAHYYETEPEAPMTFSPDGEYPVVNTEKGRMEGIFSAEWEKKNYGLRLTAMTGGPIPNAVPTSAYAKLEGVDETAAELIMKLSQEVMDETGVRFETELDDSCAEITAYGVNAHASLPHDGNNSLTGLVKLLDRLPITEGGAKNAVSAMAKLMPHGETDGASLGVKTDDPECGPLTLAFTQIWMNENGFRGLMDVRFPVMIEGDEMVRRMTEHFGAEGIAFDGSARNKPHRVPADSPLCKELIEVYENYTGLKGECIALGGQTYVHELKNGVAFGAVFPGTNTRMHAPDEFMVIDELTASVSMFAQIIADICE